MAFARVTRLHLGHFTVPEGDPRVGKKVVVEGYLVRHPEVTLLFDTGFGNDPAADALYRPMPRPIGGVLDGAGSRIADIDLVADCHLHVDHAGQNDSFAGTPILVQRAELELARGREHTVATAYDFDGARFDVLDGEREVVPGIAVVPTPGHTAGHQSLLVETASGLLFLAGQAFQGATEYAMARTAWEVMQAGAGAETEALDLFPPWFGDIEARGPAIVAFAHDTAIWVRGAEMGSSRSA